MKRPLYMALNEQGIEIQRRARLIGELSYCDRLSACAEAARAIGVLLNVQPPPRVKFGIPVFESFGMKKPQLKGHAHAALLNTRGCDLRLDFCSSHC